VHTFIFFTPSGKKYIVYFQDSSDLVYPDSPPRSLFFSINFQPVGSASRGSREDFYEPEKVRDTIIRACQIFLKKFIQKEVEIGLVFICDDQDNKETQRLRLFHRWFKSCKEITTFENFHFEFHTEKYSDGSFCCGAILNKKNATFKSQLKDFQSAVTSNLSLDQGWYLICLTPSVLSSNLWTPFYLQSGRTNKSRSRQPCFQDSLPPTLNINHIMNSSRLQDRSSNHRAISTSTMNEKWTLFRECR